MSFKILRERKPSCSATGMILTIFLALLLLGTAVAFAWLLLTDRGDNYLLGTLLAVEFLLAGAAILVFHRPERTFKDKYGGSFSILYSQQNGNGLLPVGNEQTEPLAIVSVDSAGNLSTFSPELLSWNDPAFDNFTFGNAKHQYYETICGGSGAGGTPPKTELIP